jgi:hypothetical protein
MKLSKFYPLKKQIFMSIQKNLTIVTLIVRSDAKPKYNYEQKLQKGHCQEVWVQPI